MDHTKAGSKMVKVALRSSDGQVETVWATPTEPGLFRVENSPFFFYGVSLNDIIGADRAPDGQYEFTSIAKKSGHRTLRVVMDDIRSAEGVALLKEIAGLGARYEGFAPALASIDIPPSAPFETIVTLLTDRGARWEYGDPTYADLFPSSE